MAKRYIETGFYKSPYIRGLKGSLKSLYSFIICDCDSAGIWVKDLPIASTYIGFDVTEAEFQKFVKDGKAVDLKNGKYFFPDFIEHQYPSGLSPQNPAQKKAINELKRYHLIDKDFKTLQRPSVVPTVGTKEVVVVVEEEMEEEEVVVISATDFEIFWEVYDKKIGSKPKLKKKWDSLTEPEREAALEYIPGYVKATPDKKYRKNPETFLNNKSWNDEIITTNRTVPAGSRKSDVAQLGATTFRNLSGITDGNYGTGH